MRQILIYFLLKIFVLVIRLSAVALFLKINRKTRIPTMCLNIISLTYLIKLDVTALTKEYCTVA
jgi:hypothetical protein